MVDRTRIGRSRCRRSASPTTVLATVLSMVAVNVHANPSGSYRMLEANNDPQITEAIVVSEGEFDPSLPPFVYDFTHGTGFAFSLPGTESFDVDGSYSSLDSYAVAAWTSAPFGRKVVTEAELDQFTYYRKCTDTASLTLTITQLRITARDGGPIISGSGIGGDYNVGSEVVNKPQMVGSAEMKIAAFTPTSRFFQAEGLVALNLFVDKSGDDRWPHADLSLSASAADFWSGAQFEFDPAAGGIPPVQIVQYRLTSPHRIHIDLSLVPTAPSCPGAGEAEPTDDTGEFYIYVRMRAHAETFFFSPIEQSEIGVYFQDPSLLDDNGVTVEARGLQRVAVPGPRDIPIDSLLLPDPNCVRP